MTRRATREQRRLDEQLPELASLLARSVRSGSTLLHALDDAAASMPAPLDSQLRTLLRRVSSGAGLAESMRDWSERSGSPDLALVVAACEFGLVDGGDLARALDGASVTLLDRIEIREEARALSSQARTSAATLLALPVLGAAAFAVIDPGVAATLFATPAGWLCLSVGTVLELGGVLAMSKMVRRATR